MRSEQLQRGARIVVEKWMKVQPGESVLILTDKAHGPEMSVVEDIAEQAGASVTMYLIPDGTNQMDSGYLSGLSDLLCRDVIIGAAHYSLATSDLVKKAVKNGSRFLSLPLATNDGRSLLEYGFLTMDTAKSRFVAKNLLFYINRSDYLRAETDAGTCLNFRKIGRKGNYFNGMAKDGRGFASSSFEVYVPVEETQTSGKAIVDGSLGYLGKVRDPFAIRVEEGRLAEFGDSPEGGRLSEYMKAFGDERIYHVSEFGIGLNFFAKCEGNCYIEDESAYGTFHIGFGRNVALGGEFEANGHFDIIFRNPSIYADNRMIMDHGGIIPAVPEIW